MKKFFLVPVFEGYSKWLVYELENAFSLIKEKMIVSNVSSEKLFAELKGRGINVTKDDFLEVLRTLPRPIIVLDPKAKKTLSPSEALYGTFVIGGILGNHPPLGRTSALISSKIPRFKDYVLFRNLGNAQFTIDGALAVVWQVSNGISLDEMEIVHGLKLRQKLPLGFEREVELPYAYPKVNGKVFISKALIKYLLEG